MLLVGVLSLGGLVACGGDDGPSPADLSRADLARDGAFWVDLSPEGKRKLVELGKSRLANEMQRGEAQVGALPTESLVQYADKVYEQEHEGVQSLPIGEVVVQPVREADARQAAERLERWFQGLAARDGKAACSQLTTTYGAALADRHYSSLPGRQVGTCEMVAKLIADEFEAEDLEALSKAQANATVDGDEAQATIRGGGGEVTLRRIAGRWWINDGLNDRGF